MMWAGLLLLLLQVLPTVVLGRLMADYRKTDRDTQRKVTEEEPSGTDGRLEHMKLWPKYAGLFESAPLTKTNWCKKKEM